MTGASEYYIEGCIRELKLIGKKGSKKKEKAARLSSVHKI